MKNKQILLAIPVCLLVLVLESCATNIATTKTTNFDKKPMHLIESGARQYEILGPVALEKDWSGVLGVTIDIPGFLANDAYLWQSGGVTYVELLNKAKEQFPDADAVVDINIDRVSSQYWIFYAKRTNVVGGLAIKYVKQATGSFNPNQSAEGSFSVKIGDKK